MGQERVMEQLTIFDFLDDAPKTELRLGYLRTQEDIERYKGDVIPFEDLDKYIGKLILCEMPRYGMTDYKVVLLTSVKKDSSEVYGEGDEPIGRCDRIGYSDDNRTHKENSWSNEYWFANGRYHKEDDKFLWLMREIKGANNNVGC